MKINKESVISAANCVEIIKSYLQSDNKIVITNYEVEPVSENIDGFIRSYFCLTIKYVSEDDEDEAHFFVKKRPTDNDLHHEFIQLFGAFDNELFAYSVLFNDFQKYNRRTLNCVPKFYYGLVNDSEIFEDKSFLGYQTPKIQNALSIDEIEMALKAFANFHASGIAYQENKSRELGKKYNFYEEYDSYIHERFFRSDQEPSKPEFMSNRLNSLNAIIDLLPYNSEFSREGFKLSLKKLAEECIEIMKPKSNFYNVLLHGDARGKNVMYLYNDKKKPIDCILVDFQLLRYGPPAHDVLEFIYFTTRRSDREKHFHCLLKYYYSNLKFYLEEFNINADDILTFDEFEITVNYLLPQIKLQTVYFLQFRSEFSEFYKRKLQNVEDYKKFSITDTSSLSVELFKADMNYKKMLTEAIEDLKEHIMYPRISREDCYKIMKSKFNKRNYKVLNYLYKPLKDVGGFMGDHYKLKINALIDNNNVTIPCFVKCVPENKIRCDLSVGSHLYIKEAFLLKTLLPLYKQHNIEEIESFIVPFHLIRLNEVEVFDDLEYSGFKAANPRVPFTCEELKILIDKLAIFHASSIILEEKLSTPENKIRLGDQYKDELIEAMFSKIDTGMTRTLKHGFETAINEVDIFYDIKKNISDELLKKKFTILREASFEYVKPSNKFRNVICHGDLWASNILIKYKNQKPIDCYIVDFQLLRYCPPAHDLMCLLYLLTNRHVRKNYMPELIDCYYNKLSTLLCKYQCQVENIYSYNHFIESCSYFEPLAAFQAALYFPVIMMDSDIVKEYIVDEETSKNFFLENRTSYILEVCKRDPLYREILKDSIQDIHDICLKYF